MLGGTWVSFTKDCHLSSGPHDRMAGETTIHSPDPDFLKKIYDFWYITDLLINSVTGLTMWIQVSVLISVSVLGHVEAYVDVWSDKQCLTEGARKPAWSASSQHRNNPVTTVSTTSISVSQLFCIFKQHCLSKVMLEGRSQFGWVVGKMSLRKGNRGIE